VSPTSTVPGGGGERNLFPLNLPTVSGQLLLDGFEYVYSHRQETSYTTASVTVVIILPKIMPIRTKYV
jgi:hypothetical protein